VNNAPAAGGFWRPAGFDTARRSRRRPGESWAKARKSGRSRSPKGGLFRPSSIVRA